MDDLFEQSRIRLASQAARRQRQIQVELQGEAYALLADLDREIERLIADAPEGMEREVLRTRLRQRRGAWLDTSQHIIRGA